MKTILNISQLEDESVRVEINAEVYEIVLALSVIAHQSAEFKAILLTAIEAAESDHIEGAYQSVTHHEKLYSSIKNMMNSKPLGDA